MIFFRINNNKLSSAGDTPRLGFNVNSPMYIPDEYLENGEFVVMRTSHGIGDWCIISAMPRLLKEKYPKCKVYVPSAKMLDNVFGGLMKKWGYGVYNASQITNDIFVNNPYVDGFIDSEAGEIFHDHYKIYDELNSKVPLVEQMLKFWQFKEDEFLDSTPDIYFSKDEIEFGDNLFGYIKPYGYIALTSTYGKTADVHMLVDKVNEFGDMKWLYYGETPIEDTELNFLKNTVDIKSMNLTMRQQMYLRCNADVNIGNESGMTLWCSKYSDTYALSHSKYGKIHGARLDGTIRKDPYKTGNFVRNIKYLIN
mgnify:FL=1